MEDTRMIQPNNTSKPRKGQHLSLGERIEIQSLHDRGFSNRAIGRLLERPHATINNEIKRGTVDQVQKVNQKQVFSQRYFAETGQSQYQKNRQASRRPIKLNTCMEFVTYAIDKIKHDKWSPDAVSGYVKLHGLFNPASTISTRTLYTYIDLGLIELTNMDLLLKLRRNTKRLHTRRNKRILGTSIEDRPKEVNDRNEFGHWEIDTVIGIKHKDEPVLLTLTERKHRFELILKLTGKNEVAVHSALQPLMQSPYAKDLFKTITSDNGSEFASLVDAVKNVADVYFTHPYTSCERGTNENHNGIIRRFIPKGVKISTVSNNTIRTVNHWMNSLPRKILGYSTPHECMAKELQKLITI